MIHFITGQFYEEFRDDREFVASWTIVATLPDPDLAVVVVYVRNDTRTSRLYRETGENLTKLIAEGTWAEASFPRKPFVRADHFPPERKALADAERDKRFALIKPVLDLGIQAFDTNARRACILRLENPGAAWFYLCLYWQLGSCIEALYPRGSIAGAKSLRTRIAACAEAPERFVPYKSGRKSSPDGERGKALEYQDIVRCRRVAAAHLFKPSPDHKLHYRWKKAHDELMLHYGAAEDPKIPAPSPSQFRKIITSDPKFLEHSKKIIGQRHWNLNYRQLKHSSRIKVLGPGQLLQMDDCAGKVILLDPITRLPLGAGRFFSCIDSNSGVMPGVHDTLEGSTYEEACECLFVAFSDKRAHFEERGIDADASAFPDAGVFKGIAVDNGPFRGKLSDDLPRRLSGIKNLPGYRPDLKAMIESSFHAYLRQVASDLPGYNRTERCRGDDNPKIAAYLTTKEYRTILWRWVARHNREPIKGWLPLAAMESEELPSPTPLGLWKSGIEGSIGQLTAKHPDDLRRALLIRTEVPLSLRRGLKLGGLTYVFDESEYPNEHYLAISNPRKVTVYYSQKYTKHIFVEIDDALRKAHLKSDEMEMFGNLTFKEVAKKKSQLDAKRQLARKEANQRRRQDLAKLKDTKERSLEDNLARYGSVHLFNAVANATATTDTRNAALRAEREEAQKKIGEAFKETGRPLVDNAAPKVVTRKLSIDEMLEQQ